MRVEILHNYLNISSSDELVSNLIRCSAKESKRTLSYVNPHCVLVAVNDIEYKNILKDFDFIYPDGIGLIWAARVLGLPLKERVHIFDFFDEFAQRAREKDLKFYLLGAEQKTIECAAQTLHKKYGLSVVGFHNGYFPENQEQAIIHEINQLKPNILLVGMGVPKQEKWIARNIEKLNVNVCWAIGGAFNNFGGKLAYAPQFMRRLGLQWLFRLFQEPRRLGKRYLIGIPVFVYWVFKERLTKSRNKQYND